MKALVLGGDGMLGHKMFQTLLARFPDTGCTILGSRNDHPLGNVPLFRDGNVIEHLNAMAFEGFAEALRARKPEFLINCIGIVKQRDEAKAHIPSITINALFPHRLAELAEEWGGRVIHFSTDCVFSGKGGQYKESDASDAEDLYGKSKYLGEVSCDNALTLRTSIIGRELTMFASLLEWFLTQDHKTVKGFTKVIYAGVTTNYLSEVVSRILDDFPTLSGLYQVTSAPTSKYDLLLSLKDAYGLDIDIVKETKTVSDRSMVGTKFLEKTGLACPAWPALVAQLANDPTPYGDWR